MHSNEPMKKFPAIIVQKITKGSWHGQTCRPALTSLQDFIVLIENKILLR